MMKIVVKLYGTLRRFSKVPKPGVWEGDVVFGTTIREIFSLLKIPEKEVAAAAVDGRRCDLDFTLEKKCTLILVSHIGGG